MRLLSLVFTLAFISAAVYYYMKSGTMMPGSTGNTAITHTEAMDRANQSVLELNKSLERQNKQIEELETGDN